MTQPDLEILRVAVREQVEKEGLRPFSDRTGVPLGKVRGFLDGRDSPFSSIRQLAEAVGIDWYMGATDLFGQRIKVAREEAGLSIAALSRRTGDIRSEEHTSELKSRSDLVCRLLLEKKKNDNTQCHLLTHHNLQVSQQLETQITASLRQSTSKNLTDS